MSWTKEQQKASHVRWYIKMRGDPIRSEKYDNKGKEEWIKIKNNPEKLLKYKSSIGKWRSTVSGIYVSLRNRGRKDFDLKKEDFIEWYNKQEGKCSYCKLTLEEIRKLPPPYNRKNGLNKFSIDRKDNNLGYTIENITLSCFTCNTIKNNFLTYEEMLKIGKDIIEPKLRKLLN